MPTKKESPVRAKETWMSYCFKISLYIYIFYRTTVISNIF